MNTRNKHLLGFIFLVLPAINANSQEVAEGLEIFDSTCAHCHGGSGQGGTLGPAIHERVLQENDQDLITFLRAGNPEKGMPPVIVADNEMTSLLQYLDFH